MKKHVWIDTDLSVGMKRHHKPGYCDVDDGYAILQLMRSEAVELVGMSAVFGNTLIDNAYHLCKHMSETYAAGKLPVYKGAEQAMSLAHLETNDAVEALAKALERQKLTIMAIGPATNIGLLVMLYPHLVEQIEEVVLVAGRRKASDHFTVGTRPASAPDLNFDLDNDAFRVLFQHQVPLVFCPFEISNKVWLSEQDLDTLAKGDAPAQWLAEHSRPWLQQWIEMNERGFNPFDVLASHYIIRPQDIVSEALNARLEAHLKDDMEHNDGKVYKQFLLCDRQPGYPVKYCYNVVPDYHDYLMRSLLNTQ
jgi:pyrimidine-specific ribonucleoside hydrolase